MSHPQHPRLSMTVHNEPLPLSAPFRISGYVFDAMPATVVTLREGAYQGRGEAAGVFRMRGYWQRCNWFRHRAIVDMCGDR